MNERRRETAKAPFRGSEWIAAGIRCAREALGIVPGGVFGLYPAIPPRPAVRARSARRGDRTA